MDGAGFPSWAVFLLEGAFPYWVNWMIHSAVLIAAGLFISHAVRKRGAAVQSLVLRISLLAVCLSPLVTAGIRLTEVKGATAPLPRCLVVSDREAGAPAWMMQGGVVISPPALLARDRSDGLVSGPSAPARPKGKVQSAAERRSIRDGWLRFIAAEIVLVSSAVSCWLLINILIAVRFVRRIVESADDAMPEFSAECAELALRMGVRPPRILFSSLVRSPFVFGLFRPVVLLPSVDGDDDAVGREVLVHEFAHLRRRDSLWNLLSKTVTTALPFQPLLRLLARRIEEASDAVCDDYVVRHCDDPRTYARRLYHLACRFRADRYETAVGLGVVSLRSSLGRRIERILDDRRTISLKTSFTAFFRTGLLFVGLTVILGFTGIRPRTEAIRPESAERIVRSIQTPVAVHQDRTAVTGAAAEMPSVSVAADVSPSGPKHSTPAPESDAASGTASLTVKSDYEPLAPAAENASPEPSPATGMESSRGVNAALLAFSSPKKVEPPAASPAPAPIETVSAASSPPGGLPPKPTTAAEFRVERMTGWYEEAAGNVSPVKIDLTTENEAIVLKKRIVELTNFEECMQYGALALRKRDFTGAEEAFLRALAFSPSDRRVMNALGLTFRMLRDDIKALRWFREAIGVDPKNPEAYYNIGDIHLSRGDLKTAMEYQKKALSLNPAYKSRTRVYY